MKKIKLFSLSLLTFSIVFTLTGCNENKKTGNALIVEEAKEMSIEELTEKARIENGNFVVYSTSSKTDATVKDFFNKYKLEGEAKAVKISEKDYYGAVGKLIDGNSKDIDAMVTQNGASLSAQVSAGNAITYTPNVSGIIEDDLFAFMYYFKEFAIDKKFKKNIDNVWELIDTKSDVYYKKSGEPINQLFLAELTTEKWSTKLAEAYDLKYGKGACKTVLKEEKIKNAGYLFIDKFLKKVTDYESEGKIANNMVVGAEKETIGFSPITKYSTGEEGTYNKVKILDNMKGFKGYAYKFYAEISKTTDRPYTAMLFMNYLSTSEGVSRYQTGNGVYSSNASVQPDINNLLEGMVIENYADVKNDWPSIVRLLESYAA